MSVSAVLAAIADLANFVKNQRLFVDLLLTGTKVTAGQRAPVLFRLNPENCLMNMEKKDLNTWLRRFGVAGFLFFFIKGLVWLAVLFGLGKAGCSYFQ